MTRFIFLYIIGVNPDYIIGVNPDYIRVNPDYNRG